MTDGLRVRLGPLLQTTLAIVGCALLAAVAAAGAVYSARTTPAVSRAAANPLYWNAPGTHGVRSSRTRHAHRSCRAISHRASHRQHKLHIHKLRTGCHAARGRHSPGAHKPPRGGLWPHAVTTPNAAARARASTIANLLATPCKGTEVMPEPGNIPLVRAGVLCLINMKRAENGEAPLKLSGQLEGVAEAHSREMVSADYFDHVSPTGATPADRARSSGYIPNADAGYVIGENIAWGTLWLATPKAIVEAWLASPAHLANILEGHYRETGIGVAPAVPEALSRGAAGATYSQEFGVIER